MMDLAQIKEIAGYIVLALIFGGGGGYLTKRNLKKDAAVDLASDSAQAIYQQAIKFAREQLKDRDARIADLQAQILTLEGRTAKEFGYVQKFNRDTASDIRKLARSGNVAENELDTQILRTGMEPLG